MVEVFKFTFLGAVTILIMFIVCSIFSGCAATPIKPPSLIINWDFEEQPKGMPQRACLDQEDVDKVTEALVRCGNE